MDDIPSDVGKPAIVTARILILATKTGTAEANVDDGAGNVTVSGPVNIMIDPMSVAWMV